MLLQAVRSGSFDKVSVEVRDGDAHPHRSEVAVFSFRRGETHLQHGQASNALGAHRASASRWFTRGDSRRPSQPSRRVRKLFTQLLDKVGLTAKARLAARELLLPESELRAEKG